MKKSVRILSMTALMAAFSLSVSAQDTQSSTSTTTTTTASSNNNNNDDDDDAKGHFGIRGGLNFSNLYNVGEDVTDQNVKFGYNIGIFAKAPLGGNVLSIQPELLLISKGTTSFYEFNAGLNPPGRGQLDFNLNYLELPVMAVINFNRYINVQGGVYGAYLLSANIKNTSENSNYNSYQELNRGDFNNFDYGLSVGAGIDLYPIVLGVRYDYGLRQIGNSDNARFVTNDARNSCLQVYAGIGF